MWAGLLFWLLWPLQTRSNSDSHHQPGSQRLRSPSWYSHSHTYSLLLFRHIRDTQIWWKHTLLLSIIVLKNALRAFPSQKKSSQIPQLLSKPSFLGPQLYCMPWRMCARVSNPALSPIWFSDKNEEPWSTRCPALPPAERASAARTAPAQPPLQSQCCCPVPTTAAFLPLFKDSAHKRFFYY